MNLETILEWYQQRIGLYDKQSWETTVEQRILRGLSYSPRKTAKQKTDLIDVDLVRGSTFPKAKPQSDVWLAGLHGIIRILFLPICFRWWIKETTYIGFLLVVSMYCSVITTGLIYVTSCETKEIKIIPGSEVLLPAALLILLSIILSQMACTRRKGIKVAFRGKRIGRTVRNGRKPRNSRRNSLVTELKGFGKSCNSTEEDSSNKIYAKENSTKGIRTFDSSCRSHSEDLHSGHTLEFENRSASENNLLLNYERDHKISEVKTDPDNKNINLSSQDVSPAESSFEGRLKKNQSTQERWSMLKPTKECKVRYRGCVANKYKFKGEGMKEFTRPSFREFINTGFERSSDGCSDGEEGCHADCESPTTDEDEVNQREKKSNFKIGSKTFIQRQPLSPQKSDPGLLTLPNSHQKFPFVAVQDDDSNSSCDSDGEKCSSSLPSQFNKHKFRGFLCPSRLTVNQRLRMDIRGQPLFADCVGITTNSEDPSYSSESEAGWDDLGDTGHREPIDWHIQGAPAAVISSTTEEVDKGEKSALNYLTPICIGCKIWEDSEMKKVDLSVLDISSAIISRVDSLHQSSSYLMFGLVMGGILSLVPSLYRLLTLYGEPQSEGKECNHTIHQETDFHYHIVTQIFGDNYWCFLLIVLNGMNRFVLGSCFFFLLSVAERTFKQRFLYAKHFCYLTSARRARKYDLPHFRLNKVINIKSWLSIRSCLKKRGPQHSVDVIISATFIVTLLLVFYLGVEALKDEEKSFQPLHNCELFVWCFAVSIYLIRFMTLGALINKKYSNPSVLITEQINMYLHMEQNPQKKDNLMLANNVLKLVSVLLKELDSPFKISGLSANTLLYNITKFGILSACSGVLSNLLGFKLKLHNIKFR